MDGDTLTCDLVINSFSNMPDVIVRGSLVDGEVEQRGSRASYSHYDSIDL